MELHAALADAFFGSGLNATRLVGCAWASFSFCRGVMTSDNISQQRVVCLQQPWCMAGRGRDYGFDLLPPKKSVSFVAFLYT